MKLNYFDLKFAYQRLPKHLVKIMQDKEWIGSIFVGGGFIRSIVTNEPINDIDVFVKSKQQAELLALKIAKDKSDVHETDNAFTIKGNPVIQVIHRWVFENPEDVANSFDFTICCAVIFCKGIPNYIDQELGEKEKIRIEWDSFCDSRFYEDLAGKRIVYRSPIRNEDAGGSMLRVLKYYQKGYRIPLNSLGKIIARLMSGIDYELLKTKDEAEIGKIITGLLREVDPDIDPTHAMHLPSEIEI
jgi:hypothetical protein